MGSWNPHGGLQPSVTSVPLLVFYTCGTMYTHRQNTHTNKTKMKRTTVSKCDISKPTVVKPGTPVGWT